MSLEDPTSRMSMGSPARLLTELDSRVLELHTLGGACIVSYPVLRRSRVAPRAQLRGPVPAE